MFNISKKDLEGISKMKISKQSDSLTMMKIKMYGTLFLTIVSIYGTCVLTHYSNWFFFMYLVPLLLNILAIRYVRKHLDEIDKE